MSFIDPDPCNKPNFDMLGLELIWKNPDISYPAVLALVGSRIAGPVGAAAGAVIGAILAKRTKETITV